MGLFDFLKSKNNTNSSKRSPHLVRNSPDSYVDSGSISIDERPFYQPDSYYTFFSYPGTDMAVRVIPFEERKQTTYPSARGLYVAEIMLLEYCNKGKYPKPNTGYPGFWWFKYGIRDVGHAMESLEQRGFLKWSSKTKSLKGLTIDELKQILLNAGLPITGKKADLISRISTEISEQNLIIPNYVPKYELTDLGKLELEENGYIPYMHNHSRLTTEDSIFGETFTVWDINRLFPNGNAKNWRQVVGEIERKRFGVDMANSVATKAKKPAPKKGDVIEERKKIRDYLTFKQDEISNRIKTKGDGFDEQSKGLLYKSIGKDKEALVEFFVAIGKKYYAPALYLNTAILLRKYKMYEEELSVIEDGLKNVPYNNRENELAERKEKVIKLINKKL